MGTRADFYVGVGPNARWIGSVGWDGYEFAENGDHPIMLARTEKEFVLAVDTMLRGRQDATFQSDGWPWPWETSALTDYTYWWDRRTKCVRWARFDKVRQWPNMREVQNVTFGERSGLMVVSIDK